MQEKGKKSINGPPGRSVLTDIRGSGPEREATAIFTTAHTNDPPFIHEAAPSPDPLPLACCFIGGLLPLSLSLCPGSAADNLTAEFTPKSIPKITFYANFFFPGSVSPAADVRDFFRERRRLPFSEGLNPGALPRTRPTNIMNL